MWAKWKLWIGGRRHYTRLGEEYKDADAGKDKYHLQQHHIGMIKINPTKRFFKGKPHILMDFLDPCDRITSMFWYPGIDPFKDHDFSLDIPNPRTRKKAEEIPAYADYTIGAKGLWNIKARSRW